MAVIDDADQLAAACLDLHAYAGGASVQGVLEQLLHHRSGTLDHLARGDLVGNLVGKDANTAHRVIVRGLRFRLYRFLAIST